MSCWRRSAPSADVAIEAEGDNVVWTMTPNRARKVARVLRAHTAALSEAARLETAAREAQES